MVSSLTLTFHGVWRGPAAGCPSEDRAAAAYTVDAGRLEHALDMIEPRSCSTVAGLPSASHGQRLVVTFDDGLASDFTIALPALLDRGLKATFFVTVDNIGRKGYTTAAQLREMSDAGMEIASHGLTHRYLVSMSRREAVREICESKTRLEQQLGQRVTSFAPVGGHFHGWMAGAVAEAGYRAMATMVPGRTVRSGRPLMLRRNHVQSHHDCEYIARLVAGHRPTLTAARLRHQLLRLPKSILGMRNYDRLKSRLLRATDSRFNARQRECLPLRGTEQQGETPTFPNGNEMSESIYLTVILPVRNEERYIRDTLSALAGQDYRKDRYELLVVDGRSTDRTRQIVEQFAAENEDLNLRLLDNPGMTSARARNIGVRAATGQLIAVIDGHVHIPNDRLLLRMEEIAERSGQLCLARPAPLRVPKLGKGSMAWIIAVARESWMGHSRRSHIYDDTQRTVDPVSSGFAYDRRVFDLAGYFDEDFDAAEDVEFHHRLKLAGIEAVTSPDLTIYSYPRETLRGLFGQMTRYGIGRARLVRRHPTAMTKETLIPPAVLLVCGLAPLAAAASWWVPLVGLAWLCLLMPYLMALAATGLVTARKRNRAALGPLVSLVIWTTHVGLGWGFLRTILLPGRCIFPSRRVPPAPCRPMLNDA